MIGVDTCFIIDIINKKIPIEKIPSEEIAISSIVSFEFYCNANKEEILLFEEILQSSQLLLVSQDDAKLGAKIWKEKRKEGKEIGRIDAIISATYINNNITKIVTKNEKHFKGILEVIMY